MNASNVLADTLDKTRTLTNYFLHKLKDLDPYQKTNFGGQSFNSIYWITAHLIWAEHNLIVKCSGGPMLDLNELNHYLKGSDGSLAKENSSYDDLLIKQKEVHLYCLNYVKAQSEEWLELENTAKFGMNGDATNRFLIQHAIRHEGNHAGQLLWIGKMNGLQLIK
jgi:hypothetical protein